MLPAGQISASIGVSARALHPIGARAYRDICGRLVGGRGGVAVVHQACAEARVVSGPGVQDDLLRGVWHWGMPPVGALGVGMPCARGTYGLAR